MNNYKSFSELKEELGNNYDFKLYEMGISALKEIENLQQENKQLQQQCKKQKEVIDKAIEYIEKWQSFQHTNGTTHEELRNLKSILKGSDKE